MSLSNLIQRMRTLPLACINKRRLAASSRRGFAQPVCIFWSFVCMRGGVGLAACCGLFGSRSVINCSMFTPHARLNSNICLDGVRPVRCRCLRRAGAGADGSPYLRAKKWRQRSRVFQLDRTNGGFVQRGGGGPPTFNGRLLFRPSSRVSPVDPPPWRHVCQHARVTRPSASVEPQGLTGSL